MFNTNIPRVVRMTQLLRVHNFLSEDIDLSSGSTPMLTTTVTAAVSIASDITESLPLALTVMTDIIITGIRALSASLPSLRSPQHPPHCISGEFPVNP